MSINWNVFVLAIGIGIAAEYLTWKYPTLLKRYLSLGKVVVIALVISLLPGDGARLGLIGLLIARVGDVFGEAVYNVTTWARIRYDIWATDKQKQAELSDESTTI